MAVVPAQSCDSVGFHMDNKSGRDSEFRAIPTKLCASFSLKAQRLNLIQETLIASCSRAIPVVWILQERSVNSGEECPDSGDLDSLGVLL